MQIILLIPVETRLSLEQTAKPNQVCKRPLRIYLHGLCVGPIQTLRSLIEQFAFQLEVLPPEKKIIILHIYRAAQWEHNHKQQILFTHASIPCSPPQQTGPKLSALYMIQLQSRVVTQGKLPQVPWEKKELCKVLLSDPQLFFISAVYHPSLNKTPVLFLLIHLCKYFTSLKPAQLQNSCQASKPTSFLLHKHWICVPKGAFGASSTWCTISSWLITHQAVFTGSRGFVWGQILKSLPSKRGKNTKLGAQHQRILPSGHPALQGAHPDAKSRNVQFHLYTLVQMLYTAHPPALNGKKLPSIKDYIKVLTLLQSLPLF